MVLLTFRLALTSAWDYSGRCLLLLARLIAALRPGTQDATSGDLRSPVLRYHAKLRVLGRPSVAGPVFARVFGPQTGVQKNHFFRSLEGAKSLENL